MNKITVTPIPGQYYLYEASITIGNETINVVAMQQGNQDDNGQASVAALEKKIKELKG